MAISRYDRTINIHVTRVTGGSVAQVMEAATEHSGGKWFIENGELVFETLLGESLTGRDA